MAAGVSATAGSSPKESDDIRMYLPRTNESNDGDKNFMVFERNTSAWGPRFYLASEEFVRPKIQSRINKELKAKIKPHMDAFYEWVCAMAPILPSAPSWASSADADDYHERAVKYREYRINQTKKLVDAGVMTGFWIVKFVPKIQNCGWHWLSCFWRHLSYRSARPKKILSTHVHNITAGSTKCVVW
jgi:hypothetical protein